MRFKLAFLLFVLILPVAAFGTPAHALATYLDLPDSTQTNAFATDGAGNFFVASYATEPSGRQTFRLTKTDWGTGARGSIYPEVDGEIAKRAGNASGPISVLLQSGGFSLEVLYAGDSPGMVVGVVQVNFRLPSKLIPELDPFPRVFFQLQTGDAISAPFSIYVTP